VGVHNHQLICTVCGDTLENPPPTRRVNATASFQGGVRAIPEFMTEEFRQVGREFRTVLSSMREQVAIPLHDINEDNHWQEIPPELLAPQNVAHRGRPTAKAILAKIPRIILEERSSLLRQASLQLSSSGTSNLIEFSCIPAEFGPTRSFEIDNSTLILASPLTAKGGLKNETKTWIKQSSNPTVYLERGDGVTYVSKALQAQSAGAVAAIIGNSMSTPWPYAMKDSLGEAQKCGLKIPVVMIKQQDGKTLMEYFQKHSSSLSHTPVVISLKIQSTSKDCSVCCDTFGVKETVMCLPLCGHLFHERCALTWLTAHNTCPFCRRELPTDDFDYEQERQRAQRTHAGSRSDNDHSQWSGYYG